MMKLDKLQKIVQMWITDDANHNILYKRDGIGAGAVQTSKRVYKVVIGL